MSRYRNRPREVEVMTFQELIAYGNTHTVEWINGMPKSFKFNGHSILYENTDTYLIPTLESGEGAQRFSSGDMLVIGLMGEIYPCRKDIFDLTYEKID